MAATLNVQFANPTDTTAASQDAVRVAIQQAFATWTQYFDYTAGSFTINVSYRAVTQPTDVSLVVDNTPGGPNAGVNLNPTVGLGRYPNITETAFGLDFAGRNGAAPPGLTLTLYVNPAIVTDAASANTIVVPTERELEHALGVQTPIPNVATGPVPHTSNTVYGTSVQFVQQPPNAVTAFDGPNAQAVYGGPVPVTNDDPGTTAVAGGQALNTTTQPAATVQPLDVALLRDAGLPALTDQELGEHQVARLYVAAFGREADSAGLLANDAALRGGATLAQVADSLVSSAEFTGHNGTLSDTDFVTLLYRNALGRTPDAAGLQAFSDALEAGTSRGTVLAEVADSDEARGRLSVFVDPNLTYAGTAEAQIARLYDTALGRAADPQGFTSYVQALINGETLQQVALSFVDSAEFTARYGAAVSDHALVDALYADALHRAPDAAGAASFMQALSSGQLSRAGLIAAFSDSPEHIALVAQQAAARNAQGYNIDTSPQLGIVPTIGPVPSS